MAQDDRPPIPLPMKRAVRQRCGFGCVICGTPVYEYEHMEQWAIVKHHVAEEITLLCPRHHSERTKNLLPIEVVRAEDRNPYNRRQGISPKYLLHYSGNDPEATIGGNSFRSLLWNDSRVLAPIIVDGLPLVQFRLEDDQLLLSVRIFDVQNRPVFTIEDNELTYSTALWDVEFVGRQMTIRHGSGDIYLNVEFFTPNRVVITRGFFLYNGVQIQVDDDSFYIPNVHLLMSNCASLGANAGIVVGQALPGMSAVYHRPTAPRYPDMVVR